MNARAKYTIIIKLLAIALLILAVTWLAHLGWHTAQLARQAAGAMDMLQGGAESVQPEQALDLLKRSARHLAAVDRDLRPLYPVFNFISPLPGVGRYAGQVQPLVQFALSLSRAGERMVEPLLPLLQPDDYAGGEQSMTERLLQVLQDGTPQFQLAAQDLQRASELRQQIDASVLPEKVRPAFEKLDENFPLIEQGAALLPLLPGLMGAEQPFTYLVLAQNRDELRAGGGFITGIGLVRLEQGRITQFDIGDSYGVDDFSKPYPPPPEPIQRLMLAGYWVTRDANWSPDFPSSALQAQSLYSLSTNVETQGVVAFDQLAISGLLSALGPVSLPDVPDPITAENVETYMQQAWAPVEGESLEWWYKRKDFMGVLGKSLLERVFQVRDPATLASLAGTGLELIRTGHVLVYINDPQVQSVLAQMGLDGGLHPGEADFLMLVDTNMGFNKTDTVVQRTAAYRVDLSDPENPSSHLELNYQHTIQADVECVHVASYGKGTYADMQARCYWDYWRVYRPAGSQLVSAKVKPVRGEWLLSGQAWPGVVEEYEGEAGTQVFAGLFVLKPKQSETIELDMSLPQLAVQQTDSGEWLYSLRVKKQAGLAALPFRLEVLPPAGYQVTGELPGWTADTSGSWVWQGSITRDEQFRLIFSPQVSAQP